MTPRQFKVVKALFDRVCDLPAEVRAARLREHTDDQEIIDEVLRLTGQTSLRTTRFAMPIMHALGALGALASDELKAGDKLGAWTLGEEIGHGGMGAVYLAQRSDGHFEQTAAIKVIYGVPSSAALEYLARERQILADLSHPNIARLIDGGATPMGQPYLVMEYIDGVPMNRYITDNALTTKQVLRLFLQVFDAVGFAHQQLVVHCDLKPSNILVSSEGRSFLLDFGIARLIDSASAVGILSIADASGTAPAPGPARAHTPHYASPEQREGSAVSTKTDIYTLGILLRDVLVAEIERDADITAIVKKATAADEMNRYASVDAFAKDIARYLAHEPVEARAATLGYQAQKFVERRWPWVAVASMFVMVTGAFTMRVVSERDRAQGAEQVALKERDATQLARAEAERERDRVAKAEQAAAQQRDRATAAEATALAERDRAKGSEMLAVHEKNRATLAEATARQTSEFLVSVFDASSPDAQSGDIPASKLIAAAEARLEKQLQGQPETQATLYSTLARVQSNMGAPTKARQNYHRAIEIERKLNRPLELARTLTLEFQNDVLKLDNRNLVALASEALKLREKFAPADSDELAQSLAFMAYAYRATSGDLKEAERLILRSSAIREKRDPVGIGMAETMHIAGQVYSVLGKREKAIESYRRSISIKLEKFGEGHPEALLSLQYLAGELNRTRQFVEAEKIFRQIVAQNEKLHGRQNVNMLRPLIYLGLLLGNSGRPREALQLAQEALQIAEKTVGRDSTYAALAMGNVGRALMDLGNDQGAATYFREALGLMKKYMRPIDNAVAEQEVMLGRALNRLGKFDESRPHLLAAHGIYRAVLGEAHRETGLAATELMIVAVASGNLDDARSWQTKLEAAARMDKEVAAVGALADAMLAAKRGEGESVGDTFINAERLLRDLYGEDNAKTWLAMLPRCEWLATLGEPASVSRSRALAGQILSNVRGKLDTDAPVLARLARLQL